MQLRDYQEKAFQELYKFIKYNKNANPCIVIPTGGGKTAIMAYWAIQVSQKWQGRCLIVSHVKELIEQTASTLKRIEPNLDVGIYSAGLNSRDTGNSVICASIQSIYRKASELGRFDSIVVDESHLIPTEGDGMYRTFISEMKQINPSLRCIGLTATPYRLDGGLIYGDGKLFDACAYSVSIKELIDKHYLSPIVSTAGSMQIDTEKLHIVAGEFKIDEVEKLTESESLMNHVCEDILSRACERKSILVFCPTVRTAELFCKRYKKISGETAYLITGETPTNERDNIVNRFKNNGAVNLLGERENQIRVLANVNVLSTGFDAPNVDCIVLLRPTCSPGLYYQQVGRGFRICEGKTDCLLLDYAGNVERHGCVDQLTQSAERMQLHTFKRSDVKKQSTVKACPDCHTYIQRDIYICPNCNHEFDHDRLKKLELNPTNRNVLSFGEDIFTFEDHVIKNTFYSIHEKRDYIEGDPRTIQVEYIDSELKSIREWICPEHDGFAYRKFQGWWDSHVCPEFRGNQWRYPRSCEEFMYMAEHGAIATPETITVRRKSGEKYGQVVKYNNLIIPDANVYYDNVNRENNIQNSNAWGESEKWGENSGFANGEYNEYSFI